MALSIHKLPILALPVLLSCGTEVPQFNGERAYQYLLAQCEFGPRNPGSLGHERAKNYLISQLEERTPRVESQIFSFLDDKLDSTFQLTNIIASFYPEESQKLLLCAHWDTRPRADRDPLPQNRDRPIVGANDGASGVAVLLELAGILETKRPKYGVDIVLFDGEDYGEEGNLDNYLIGSRYFSKGMKPSDYRYGILLDMVGDEDLDIYMERNSLWYAPQFVKLIWDKAEEMGLTQFHRQVGPSVWDDHIPLNSQGTPTVDLIDFEYPHWHTMRDTPDKCSPASLQAVGDLLVHLLYSE